MIESNVIRNEIQEKLQSMGMERVAKLAQGRFTTKPRRSPKVHEGIVNFELLRDLVVKKSAADCL